MVNRLLVKKRKKLIAGLTREIPASGIITVGNDASATIELRGEKIAPEQFVIVCENQSMTLLCRVDGTKVNGRVLPQGALHDLRFGDEIAIDGGYTLMPDNGEPAPPPASDDVAEQTSEEAAAEPAAEAEPRFEKSLSDVLGNLHGEEKFYFEIESPTAPDERVDVSADEMYAGWNEAGECVVTTDESEVAAVRAIVRKDWSGVAVEPARPGSVRVNDETPAGPRRLRNDDVVRLLGREGTRFDNATTLRFREPSALLLLDSLLPRELPPPISLDDADAAGDSGAGEIDEADAVHLSRMPGVVAKNAERKRNIFGYFTITEIIVMAFGTLITAAVIFLVLEYF